MMETPVSLEQIISKMVDSERLLIVDETGQELYRDFVANVEQSGLDKTKLVTDLRLLTNVFRRGKLGERIPQPEKVEVKMDNPTAYSFSDLEFIIYIKITLKSI